MHFMFLPVCLEIGIIVENILKNIFGVQMGIFFVKKATFWVIWNRMKITPLVMLSSKLDWKINPTTNRGN